MNFERISRPVLSSLLMALLCVVAASCNVGPDYHRPAVTMPTTFKSATTQEAPLPKLTRDWWKLFGDPQLNQLELTAVQNNNNLQAAVARVMQARAAARVTDSAFYPAITFDPSVQRTRTSANIRRTSSLTSGRSSTLNDISIPFDLSYEVDIWGRIRRSSEASHAQVHASADDLEVVLQTLESDVAQNYFTLRSLDLQATILAKTVESFRRQLSLTQTQFKSGLVGQIDVMQAETQLDSTITQEIDVRRQRDDTEHALAILLGKPPSELAIEIKPLDLTPPIVPIGMPADLLRQRPDVAEAEQNLIAASAQVGVATALFYPTVTLTGSAGYESTDVAHSLDWESRLWSIGPSVSLPIFEGGKLRANLEQARQRYNELQATYRNSVLTAFGDVEDSLTDLHRRADAAVAQQKAVESARDYVRLAEIQYKNGLTNYLLVIDADRTLLSNELSAVQLLNQRLTSTVLLIKALGGGWQPEGYPATQPSATTE